MPWPTHSPAFPALRCRRPPQPLCCDKHQRGSGPMPLLLHALPHPHVPQLLVPQREADVQATAARAQLGFPGQTATLSTAQG